MYIFLPKRKKGKVFVKKNDEKLRYAIVDCHSSLWWYFHILDIYCTLSLLVKSRVVLILVRNSLEVGHIMLNNRHTKTCKEESNQCNMCGLNFDLHGSGIDSTWFIYLFERTTKIKTLHLHIQINIHIARFPKHTSTGLPRDCDLFFCSTSPLKSNYRIYPLISNRIVFV